MHIYVTRIIYDVEKTDILYKLFYVKHKKTHLLSNAVLTRVNKYESSINSKTRLKQAIYMYTTSSVSWSLKILLSKQSTPLEKSGHNNHC